MNDGLSQYPWSGKEYHEHQTDVGVGHPGFTSVDHLDGHLALGVDLGKLFLDVLQNALGDLGGGHVRYQSNREFAC